MGSGPNFFVVSCALLALAAINMGVSPIMNEKLGTDWDLENCEKMDNDYEDYKHQPYATPERIDEYEFEIKECKDKKTMYNMEYTSLILNIVIGFICLVIGLYGLQNEVIPKSGLVGMVCGVVGFALTLVYVIFNIIVATNYNDSRIYKRDSDGAFAEYEGNRYKCLYNKAGDSRAVFAKYIDLIKSQYNYDKDLADSFKTVPEKNFAYTCVLDENIVSMCITSEYIDSIHTYIVGGQPMPCSKLYYYDLYESFENYDQGSRILCVMIFSILILLCYCGIVFSGFMLSRESDK